jgi:hypothetical protein
MTGRPLTTCTDVAPLLTFYAIDELEPSEREQVEAHLNACPECAALLSEELQVARALGTLPQSADELDPTGALLAQCRSELSESLDDLYAPPVKERWTPFGWLRRWMALRPAWGAAFLIFLGIAFGTRLGAWLPGHDVDSGAGVSQAVNVHAAPRITDDELSKMAVAGISFTPTQDLGPGSLQLQVRTEQPVTLNGNVDDEDVRRVLAYVVANGDRTGADPGMRLDCLAALKSRIDDEQVRKALLAAARKDSNPAVRMKALEDLRDSLDDDTVRGTLLEALQHDANPGVRVEAVNLLVRSLVGETLDLPESDPGLNFASEGSSQSTGTAAAPEALQEPMDPPTERIVRALYELQRTDPNPYVRLRSAAALRQIHPREMQ